MRGPRFYLALWLSKAAALMIDVIAKGRGTNLPGAIALKIDPNFLSQIPGIQPEKTVFLTGTNGKSTTTKLLNQILTGAGMRVVSNLGGANMTAGVAAALLKSCSLTGKLNCDYVVMETDERYVSRIRKQIPAKYLGVTNIQKDQVQRNGEPGFIRDKILRAICRDMTVFLNQDEPNTLSLATADAERVVLYGVALHERSFEKNDDFFAVTMPCPVCHSGVVFDRYNLDNVGQFHCPDCGFSNADAAQYLVDAVSFEEKWFCLNGKKYPFGLNLPEFLYSYTLAISIALELGLTEEAICSALNAEGNHMVQRQTHKAGNHQVKFFRIKQENSETLQSAINAISTDSTPKTMIFGLDEYIDFHPPYVNGCYMFDCTMQNLRSSGVARCISTSPALGHCGALRFLYDGFSQEDICVLPDSKEKTLAEVLDKGTTENIYLIEEIPFWKQ